MHTPKELWQAPLCDPVLAPLMQGAFSCEKLSITEIALLGFFQILIITINMESTRSPCILSHPEKVNFLTAKDFPLFLLHTNVLFESPFRKVVYCNGRWQECFQEMVHHVQFVEGILGDIPSLFPPTCCPECSY